MRIALVLESLLGGGAERVAALLARGLHDRGHGVSVITFQDASRDFYPLPEGVDRIGLGLPGGGGRWRSNLRRIGALRAALLAARPDAAVAFLPATNILALSAAAGTGIPVVATEHVDPATHSPGEPWGSLRFVLYPFAARLVSVSAGVDRGFGWLPASRRAVIGNPLPPEMCPVADTSGPLILGMGRLERQKGFDLLIRAFAGLRARFPDWRLEIWGEGSRRGELEALVEGLGLGEAVRLPGVSPDAAGVFRRGGLFVFPSRFEGFGNVLAEAMACGLPVIAADCPSGPSEIVEDGVTGLLVPPEDVGALSSAMARCMAGAGERARLASRAPEGVARLGLPAIAAKWEDLLRDSLE